MHWLDIVLGAVLIIAILNGIRHGFARTAIGFATFIVALFCGLWFYGVAGERLQDYLGSAQVSNLLGFLLIFCAVVALGAVAQFFVDRAVKAAQLSWLNRILGGVFGAVQGVLIAAVLVLGAMAFPAKEPPKAVTESRLAPYVIDTARVMVALAPREVKDAFHNSYERIEKIWAEGVRHRLPQESN